MSKILNELVGNNNFVKDYLKKKFDHEIKDNHDTSVMLKNCHILPLKLFWKCTLRYLREGLKDKVSSNFNFLTEKQLKEMQIESDCSICFHCVTTLNNPIVYCSGEKCGASFHQRCYGIKELPNEEYYCDTCSLETDRRKTFPQCQ